jgi:hypothetical protein
VYDSLKLLIKRKYSLVHVPNRHKVERWVEETRCHHAAGDSPERAGIRAARSIFPYEMKEHSVYAETPVAEILELASAERDRREYDDRA